MFDYFKIAKYTMYEFWCKKKGGSSSIRTSF